MTRAYNLTCKMELFGLNMELAEENKDRYFFIHFDNNINIHYYSVFSKKRFEFNIKSLIESNKSISYYLNNKSFGFSIYYSNDELIAYRRFKRG